MPRNGRRRRVWAPALHRAVRPPDCRGAIDCRCESGAGTGTRWAAKAVDGARHVCTSRDGSCRGQREEASSTCAVLCVCRVCVCHVCGVSSQYQLCMVKITSHLTKCKSVTYSSSEIYSCVRATRDVRRISSRATSDSVSYSCTKVVQL